MAGGGGGVGAGAACASAIPAPPTIPAASNPLTAMSVLRVEFIVLWCPFIMVSPYGLRTPPCRPGAVQTLKMAEDGIWAVRQTREVNPDRSSGHSGIRWRSHCEQSLEEVPIAGECDPEVLGGRFLTTAPLLFQA